jgi:1-acyl-sn-glycerol-3-phosphate acyltransferase
VFQVARELGMAVVPVAVTGMYDVMRAGSWIIRPGQDVTVWVDAPIETKDIGPDGVYDLAKRCRAAVARRVDAWWDAKAAR